jgi:hypothetical protein
MRSRDLPACSIVPQPTAPRRAPFVTHRKHIRYLFKISTGFSMLKQVVHIEKLVFMTLRNNYQNV